MNVLYIYYFVFLLIFFFFHFILLLFFYFDTFIKGYSDSYFDLDDDEDNIPSQHFVKVWNYERYLFSFSVSFHIMYIGQSVFFFDVNMLLSSRIVIVYYRLFWKKQKGMLVWKRDLYVQLVTFFKMIIS